MDRSASSAQTPQDPGGLRSLARAEAESARLTTDEIRRRFTYHAPTSPQQVRIYTALRTQALAFAYQLAAAVPPGPELERAIERLEECVMHANAGIARRS